MNKMKNMKNIIGVGLLFIIGNVMGQTQAGIPDTLVKLGGNKIPANIKNVTTTTIYYTLANKPKETLKMDRKDLEKAIYKNGRVEIFNNPAFTVIKEGQWETVLITRSEKDVTGLYVRKAINSKSSPTKSKKKAKENAIIKLQKQAANSGGSMVLITHEEFFGGYGDNPGYYMEATVYGPEPLEEGTNVVDDKSKKPGQPGQKSGTGNTTNQGQNKTQSGTKTTPANNTTQPAKTLTPAGNTTQPAKTVTPAGSNTQPVKTATPAKTVTPAKTATPASTKQKTDSIKAIQKKK